MPLAGMKPTGTYARNTNIASKMPVNMSYRLRLNAAAFMMRVYDARADRLAPVGKLRSATGARGLQELAAQCNKKRGWRVS